MTGGLRVSAELTLPLDAVTETFGILAVKRAGKSNAAVVIAEEMYDAGIPWVAVDPKGDWWGVRAAGDGQAPGLAVLVFGGLHGDVLLEPTAGRLVADLVVDERITCVLDVSEMSKADQRRFLRDFAQRLYKRNTEPLHLFCEEADEYIPQRVMGDDAQVVGAFETLVKRGGFKGIGVTLITQRSASLNKDVLTQVGTLFVLRTTSPQDRKAIADWIKYHADSEATLAELPSLGNGEAFVYSPEWLRGLTRIQFRRRRTFDSGATPKIGAKPRPPARLADVDLAAIKEAMAETIERQQADDPKTLRTRIAQLEKELHAKPASTIELVEIPVITDEQLEVLTDAITRWDTATAAVDKVMDLARAAVESATKTPKTAEGVGAQAQRAPRRAVAPSDRPVVPGGSVAGVELRSGARRMVEALGRMAPLRLTKSQWGTVAKLKTSGGTWSTYLSDIRRAGLIDEGPAGYTLTQAGFDYLGGQPDPMTAGELQDHYRSILRSGAVKMLDALIDEYPDSLSRDKLGERAAIATTGGTFSTYLSDLIRNGLAERAGDGIRATSILMNGAYA